MNSSVNDSAYKCESVHSPVCVGVDECVFMSVLFGESVGNRLRVSMSKRDSIGAEAYIHVAWTLAWVWGVVCRLPGCSSCSAGLFFLFPYFLMWCICVYACFICMSTRA